MEQRRENADRGVHAGHHVGNAGADLHRACARLAVRMAGDAHQAARRLEDRVVARTRLVRTGLAIAGHRTVDDAGIDLLDRFIVEAVALQVADLEVLHHDVHGLRQLANDLLSRGLGEIDRDRTLVAVGADEERVVVVRLAFRIDQIGRPKNARIVTPARALDLDHLGTEIGRASGPTAGPRARASNRAP